MHRLATVYVEIPPSPLHRAPSNSTQKENATRGMVPLESHAAALPSRKRKPSEQSSNPNNSVKDVVSQVPIVKKAKLTAGAIGVPVSTSEDATDKFPDGAFYCHQCSKKRDAASSIQCTKMDAQHRRCKVKFCPGCLWNRYGENSAEIKKAKKAVHKDQEHDADAAYSWTCPKCNDKCNCSRCRKAKGLAPTGNLTTVARRAGEGSAAEMLSADPDRIGILPGKGHQLPPAAYHPKKPKPAVPPPHPLSISIDSTIYAIPWGKPGRPKGTAAPKPRPKPAKLPDVQWTRLPLSGALPPREAEARIAIREFVLRFACIMDTKSGLSKRALDELEVIGGEGRARGVKGEEDDEEDREEEEEDDDDGEEEEGEKDVEVVGWVSDVCVRGIVVGVLGLLHDDEADAQNHQLISKALKDLHASGANLTKVWTILSVLRSSATTSPSLAGLPDPLPPSPNSSPNSSARQTRTTASAPLHITHSRQMVPVLTALIDAALRTDAVRGELDDGVKEGKERTKESRDLAKAEGERWEGVKAAETNHKSKEATLRRELHRATMRDIESTLKVAQPAYAPRFDGPLGTDMDGRVYWALTPSVSERELGIQAIIDGEQSYRARRPKRLVPENRDVMRKWAWFLAVWDEGDQCWCGIWDPLQIKAVAEWVETRAGTVLVNGPDLREEEQEAAMGLMVSGSALPHELAALVRGLKAYADLLEWRTATVEDSNENSGGRNLTPVSASNFYKN